MTNQPDTSARAVEAMIARLLTTAKLLYANAVGCAVNHYGEDFVRSHGKLGWLSDCEKDILAAEKAADMLAAQAAEIERLTKERDAAREAMAKAVEGRERVQHPKRGGFYSVVGEAELQSGSAVEEPAKLTIYQDDARGRLWARPTSEFRDGRFITLPARKEPTP